MNLDDRLDVVEKWQDDKGTKIDQMHEAMVGTPDGTKRGYNARFEILETFMARHGKWVYGLTIIMAGSITGWVLYG